MRFTKWGEYGILCSVYLARKDGAPVGAAEIAEAQQIPLQYTQQILQRLRRGKIIRSVRGPKGGYALVKRPADTTLKEVLNAAEGGTFEITCESHPVYSGQCETKACGLRSVWRDLKHAIDDLLDQRTLAMILAKEDQESEARPVLVPGPKQSIAR